MRFCEFVWGAAWGSGKDAVGDGCRPFPPKMVGTPDPLHFAAPPPPSRIGTKKPGGAFVTMCGGFVHIRGFFFGGAVMRAGESPEGGNHGRSMATRGGGRPQRVH